MNNRTRINLVLTTVILSLAVFLIATRTNETENKKITISAIRPGSIDHIAIKRTGKGNIAFNKRAHYWMMTAPLAVRANAARINAMLGLLQAQSFAQLDAAKLDMERFQLQHPAVSLQLNNHEFFFGGTNPIKKRRYVRFGDKVHLIQDTLYHQLSQKAFFFVDNKLLPEDSRPVSIQFPDYTLKKTADNWTITPNREIDQDRLKKLVSAWRSATAMAVDRYQPAESLGTISVETAQGTTLRFTISAAMPEPVLARADLGIQYHLSSYTAAQMFLEATGTEVKTQ